MFEDEPTYVCSREKEDTENIVGKGSGEIVRSRCFKRKRLIALPITDNATINDLRGDCGDEGGFWG